MSDTWVQDTYDFGIRFNMTPEESRKTVASLAAHQSVRSMVALVECHMDDPVSYELWMKRETVHWSKRFEEVFTITEAREMVAWWAEDLGRRLQNATYEELLSYTEKATPEKDRVLMGPVIRLLKGKGEGTVVLDGLTLTVDMSLNVSEREADEIRRFMEMGR